MRDWRLLDWSPFLDRPRRAGVLTDFDGTLADVVEQREQAAPVPGVTEVLGRLAHRFGRVAVVSGRPVHFLASVLASVDGLELVGLYGLERLVGGRLAVAAEVEVWRSTVSVAAAEARLEAPAGLEVEDKGLSLALHWRREPSAGAWATQWAGSVATRTGLVAQPARQAVELLPPVPLDKGSMVEELSGELGAVCYFGDDTGDMPAFAALRRMKPRLEAAVAVGVASVEQPSELAGAVDLLVDGPYAALDVLRALSGPPERP